VFLWAVLFAAAVPILALFIKHVPLRGPDTDRPASPDAADVAAENASDNTALAALE
jgi:hypothetical protein